MKIFPISGHEYKIYDVGHGAIAGLKYATKLAFIDAMRRTPGIVDTELTEPGKEIIWAKTPGEELEEWSSQNQDHPAIEFRIAEAVLHPVDDRYPFTRDVYMQADPKEMEAALSFFIENLPRNTPSPTTSKQVLKRSGTSKAVAK